MKALGQVSLHRRLCVVPRCRAGEASRRALGAQVTGGMNVHAQAEWHGYGGRARHRLLVYCRVVIVPGYLVSEVTRETEEIQGGWGLDAVGSLV